MPRPPLHAVRSFAVLIIAIATTMASLAADLAGSLTPSAQTPPSQAVQASAQDSTSTPLVLIAIFDGLRPDIVSPKHTPNIARLKQEGVHYSRSHAAFPTVTRVNGGTLVTGMWPERHGLVSNTMYVPAVDPVKPFSTGEWKELIKLRDSTGGRVVFTKTIGEYLQARGLAYVAASSGSTGSAFMLNPVAPDGVGVLISGQLDPGTRVAFPDRVNDGIRQRIGDFKGKNASDSVNWTGQVLRDYVLPELKADVLAVWFTEPDGSQHEHGAGSPEGLAELGNSDRDLGLLLDALAKRFPGRPINVMITSDHGFARHGKAVNITKALVNAKLKSSAGSDDVVVVSNGQALLLHVKNRDAEKIRRVVEFLQTQDDVDVIFTRGAKTGTTTGTTARAGRPVLPIAGTVPGTFALELIHSANEVRGADIMFSLRWSDEKNRFGVAGTQTIHSESREGILEGDASGHGGLSPYTVRNTLILSGPAFRRGADIDVPAGVVDITPTALALLGISPDAPFDGRVLREAFAGAPKGSKEAVANWMETATAKAGAYEITVRISGVGDRWYVDEASRVRR
jgi:predicted AlkP superfamily pyrophosphatase or phosphodiesterase